jgi:hypothetical protein
MIRVISRHSRIPIAMRVHLLKLFPVIKRIEVRPHFYCVEAQSVLLIRLRSDDLDLGTHELAQQRRPQDQSRLLLPSIS